MAVLTIARELGSIGVGEELTLCSTLNLHCINKATLEERFSELGIERSVFERFDECHPGFAYFFSSSSQVYWESLRTVLLKELLTSNVAIVGRGGNFLLKNLVGCFRLRLVAPIEARVKRLCAERNCSESEALNMIRQSDSAREKFCRFYYGADWRDPRGYDMVINTAEVPLEKVAAFLPALLPPAADGAMKEHLECAVQEQLIRHAILSAWNYLPIPVDIKCAPGGVVTLSGIVNSEEAIEYCEKIVRSVPGVTDVQNELHVSFPDMPMPLI